MPKPVSSMSLPCALKPASLDDTLGLRRCECSNWMGMKQQQGNKAFAFTRDGPDCLRNGCPTDKYTLSIWVLCFCKHWDVPFYSLLTVKKDKYEQVFMKNISAGKQKL